MKCVAERVIHTCPYNAIRMPSSMWWKETDNNVSQSTLDRIRLSTTLTQHSTTVQTERMKNKSRTQQRMAPNRCRTKHIIWLACAIIIKITNIVCVCVCLTRARLLAAQNTVCQFSSSRYLRQTSRKNKFKLFSSIQFQQRVGQKERKKERSAFNHIWKCFFFRLHHWSGTVNFVCYKNEA